MSRDVTQLALLDKLVASVNLTWFEGGGPGVRIIIGPLLRRVTPKEVSVFLLLNSSRRVTLTVKDGSGRVVMTGVANPNDGVQLGVHAHAVVVTASTSTGGLSPGHTYDYSLEVDGIRSDWLLNRLKPLDCRSRSSTGPSFVAAPASLSDLRVFHTSCRKPHGAGLDAMVAAEDVLVNKGRRPHWMFLTGDQIYADDVNDIVLAIVRKIAKALFGWTETRMVGAKATPVTEIKVGARAAVVKQGGFLGADEHYSSNHLLSFPEFAAMYVFAWSRKFWDDCIDLDAMATTAAVHAAVGHRSYAVKCKEWVGRLQDYKAGSLALAKVCANTPTFMMFDDHEVTDDWNLSLEWCRAVYDQAPAAKKYTSAGRETVRAGLSAYALFQAWGNDPAVFKAGWGKDFTTALKRFIASRRAAVPDAERATRIQKLEETLGIAKGRVIVAMKESGEITHRMRPSGRALSSTHDKVTPLAASNAGSAPVPRTWSGPQWHYRVRGPTYEARSLDTRTWRAFADGKVATAPCLLGVHGLWAQLAEPPAASSKAVLVVSPPPLVELPGVTLAKAAARRNVRHIYENDLEAWVEHRQGMEQMIAELVRWKRPVVLLSGDVHYAYSVTLDYYGGTLPAGAVGAPFPEGGRLICLTASAAKNMEMAYSYSSPDGQLKKWLARRSLLYGSETLDGHAFGWDARHAPEAGGASRPALLSCTVGNPYQAVVPSPMGGPSSTTTAYRNSSEEVTGDVKDGKWVVADVSGPGATSDSPRFGKVVSGVTYLLFPGSEPGHRLLRVGGHIRMVNAIGRGTGSPARSANLGRNAPEPLLAVPEYVRPYVPGTARGGSAWNQDGWYAHTTGLNVELKSGQLETTTDLSHHWPNQVEGKVTKVARAANRGNGYTSLAVMVTNVGELTFGTSAAVHRLWVPQKSGETTVAMELLFKADFARPPRPQVPVPAGNQMTAQPVTFANLLQRYIARGWL